MTPVRAVLKTLSLRAAGRTRYLALESVPLEAASTIVLGARVDRGMDDTGQYEQLHLHLSLRVADRHESNDLPAEPRIECALVGGEATLAMTLILIPPAHRST